MAKKTPRSQCCSAEVTIGGMPDFLGSKEVCTVYYVCTTCHKPCDVTPQKQKEKVTTSHEPEMIAFNVNDDIEIYFTKKGRTIYKKYCKKYGRRPIKKTKGRGIRMQLSEFMYIFGSYMFVGATPVTVGNMINILKT